MLQVRERLEDDRCRDPLRRRDEHDLVGALDREAGERAGDAGAEIQQDDLVEAREEGDELPVAIRSEGRRLLRIARCPEHVQPARQARDEGPELGGGLETVGVLEEIDERSLRAALIRRQARERAEVGVGVNG